MVALGSGTISFLHECCSSMAPVLILDPNSSSVCHAHFESVSLESVTLVLLENVNHLFEDSNLLISFSHYVDCYTFFAKVIEFQDNTNNSFAYLRMQLPNRIIRMERRMSYRVAIGEKVVPSVRLSMGRSRILFPKPKDLSLTGMSVEFHETEDPNLSPQTELWLELHLDEYEVLLKSIINRRDGNSYSLYFPEVLTKQGVFAPASLRKIVESLERALLQEGGRSDKPEQIIKLKSPASRAEANHDSA